MRINQKQITAYLKRIGKEKYTLDEIVKMIKALIPEEDIQKMSPETQFKLSMLHTYSRELWEGIIKKK